MPAASTDTNEAGEVSGFLTVRYKGGKKTRWKRKYAVLRQDAIYLSDEQGSIPDDTSELRLPGVFNSCGAYSDKKTKKKHGFVLEPLDTEQHEQWYFTCDDVEEQDKWMNAINDVISGKKVQKAVSCPEFDDIIVQSTTLQHLAKGRPKFHGRRLPAKRPRSENALNGIPENADAKSETPDSSQPNSPSRDLQSNGASTSAPASPASKPVKDSPVVKRRDKKKSAFLRGIGARVSRFLGAQPPRSPTSPGRLDAEAAQPRVPIVTATVQDGKAITRVEEEDEEVPDVVTKEDIIKMLDFVSETTELVVYKAVGIRGMISSVDEAQSNQELREASRSLRKACKSLKGTMDGLTLVDTALKNAKEISSSATDKASDEVAVAAAPIAVDEAIDGGDAASKETVPAADDMNDADKEAEKMKDDEKSNAFNDSLDNVEELEERKASVSLMDEIQKTLNGEHSMAASYDSSAKEDPSPQEESSPKENESKELDTSEQTSEEPSEPKVTEEPQEETEPTEETKQIEEKIQSEETQQSKEEKVKEEETEDTQGENSSEKVEKEKEGIKENSDCMDTE